MIFLLLALVSLAGIVGTVVTTTRDGYRRVPEHRYLPR